MLMGVRACANSQLPAAAVVQSALPPRAHALDSAATHAGSRQRAVASINWAGSCGHSLYAGSVLEECLQHLCCCQRGARDLDRRYQGLKGAQGLVNACTPTRRPGVSTQDARVCWGWVNDVRPLLPLPLPLPTPAAHLCADHRPERCWLAASRADRTAGPHRGCPPGHCTDGAPPAVQHQRGRCRAERRLAPSRLLHMVLKTAGFGRAGLQAHNTSCGWEDCSLWDAGCSTPGPRCNTRQFRRIEKTICSLL